MAETTEYPEDEISAGHPEIPAELIELSQVIEWQKAVEEQENK